MPTRLAWIVPPVLVYVASRILVTLMIVSGAARQVALDGTLEGMVVKHPIPASPSYWEVMGNWDGQWFKSIALAGYPVKLPLEDGEVAMNEWPFLPLLPMLSRTVMMLGVPFEVGASLISVVASGVAVIVFYKLVLDMGGRWPATLVAVGICSFPSSPVLQLAYADGLALLWIALILASLRSRRYVTLGLIILLLAFTRALVLPVAGLLALSWVVRWHRRDSDAFPPTDRWGIGVNTAWALAATGLWPSIAAVSTGSRGAYFATLASWHSGGDGSLPFQNWFLSATEAGAFPIAVVLLLTGILLYVPLRPDSRVVGTALQLWVLVYSVYVLVSTPVSSSMIRYLLPGLGLLWLLPGPGPTSRAGRVTNCVTVCLLVGLGLIGQWYWVTQIYTVAEHPARQPFP